MIDGEVACLVCKSARPRVIEAVRMDQIRELYTKVLGFELPEYDTNHAVSMLHCEACDLRYFWPQIVGDATFYENLQAYPWYYQDDKSEYNVAIAHVSNNSRVLEVGCGSGAFGLRIRSEKDTPYLGLEFNDLAISKARARGLDVVRLPIEDFARSSDFRPDVVCSFQVLEHVSDPYAFLASCRDAVSEGGLVIASVPAHDSCLSVASNCPLNMPPHHQTRWTDKSLVNLYTNLGLSDIEVVHDSHWTFEQKWYMCTIGYAWLFGRRTIDTPLVCDTWRYRLGTKLVSNLIKVRRINNQIFKRASKSLPFALNGHSVTVIGRK